MNSDFWEEQVSVLVREIIANCEPLIFDLLEAAQDIETHALKLKSEVMLHFVLLLLLTLTGREAPFPSAQ